MCHKGRYVTINKERKNMETNQTPVSSNVPQIGQDQMIQEIYKFTKQTRNYMRWQLYITLILVVLPLLAALFIVPFVLSSLTSSYGSLLQ